MPVAPPSPSSDGNGPLLSHAGPPARKVAPGGGPSGTESARARVHLPDAPQNHCGRSASRRVRTRSRSGGPGPRCAGGGVPHLLHRGRGPRHRRVRGRGDDPESLRRQRSPVGPRRNRRRRHPGAHPAPSTGRSSSAASPPGCRRRKRSPTVWLTMRARSTARSAWSRYPGAWRSTPVPRPVSGRATAPAPTTRRRGTCWWDRK